MVFHRYGNPRCPYFYELGDHPRWELIRAYIRDPATRVFKAVGWYCEHCHHLWDPDEEVFIAAQKRFNPGGFKIE